MKPTNFSRQVLPFSAPPQIEELKLSRSNGGSEVAPQREIALQRQQVVEWLWYVESVYDTLLSLVHSLDCVEEVNWQQSIAYDCVERREEL